MSVIGVFPSNLIILIITKYLDNLIIINYDQIKLQEKIA